MRTVKARIHDITFTTPLPVEVIKRVFHEYVSAQSRKVELAPLDPNTNPFETDPTFAAVASVTQHFGGWAVQIHIEDLGPVRDVLLRVVGHTPFDVIMWVSLRHAHLRSKGIPIAEGAYRRLQAVEAGSSPGRA
ncbi:hypothetical protein WHI96_14550 [Pseudonocardia tropica]|uniref:Uncharacterized protein n=1 Tax=Pseudonocardia tropica TaxID=681289 RepID=A0ABV1JWJ8_9PSEU